MKSVMNNVDGCSPLRCENFWILNIMLTVLPTIPLIVTKAILSLNANYQRIARAKFFKYFGSCIQDNNLDFDDCPNKKSHRSVFDESELFIKIFESIALNTRTSDTVKTEK
jgi:hypothetical protein